MVATTALQQPLPPPTTRWFDPETGKPTLEFARYMKFVDQTFQLITTTFAGLGSLYQPFDPQLKSYIPQQIKNAPYTLQLTDGETGIYASAGCSSITIPPYSGGGAVVYPVMTAITVVQVNGATCTIVAPSGGNLFWTPSAATGNRTVAHIGVVTLLLIDSTPDWIITGTGIT